MGCYFCQSEIINRVLFKGKTFCSVACWAEWSKENPRQSPILPKHTIPRTVSARKERKVAGSKIRPIETYTIDRTTPLPKSEPYVRPPVDPRFVHYSDDPRTQSAIVAHLVAKPAKKRKTPAEESTAYCRQQRNMRMERARLEGTHTDGEWTALCRRYRYRCLRCGQRGNLTKDHIIPISKGGSDHITNIQPLCLSCNSAKGAQTIDYRTR